MAQAEFVFIYSTFPDQGSAVHVAEALVKGRLAACVNIHSPMISVYEWDAKLQSTDEFPVFIKTRQALVPDVIAAARALHPYTVPCFLVLPITSGNEDYLDWARAQTRAS